MDGLKKLKNVKTISLKGKAIQYDGNNIVDIANYFSLPYTKCRSVTTWNGETFKDIRLHLSTGDSDLIAGDYVFQQSPSLPPQVIPMHEFEKYFEENNE